MKKALVFLPFLVALFARSAVARTTPWCNSGEETGSFRCANVGQQPRRHRP